MRSFKLLATFFQLLESGCHLGLQLSNSLADGGDLLLLPHLEFGDLVVESSDLLLNLVGVLPLDL